jgi:N-acetylmuramoyl-L-alanine amidase
MGSGRGPRHARRSRGGSRTALIVVAVVIGIAGVAVVGMLLTRGGSVRSDVSTKPTGRDSGTTAAHPSSTVPATTTPPTTAPLPLAGKVVGIDPGHNGGNFSDPTFLNQTIWNGRESESCDTTGTETDGGYTEAAYNFSVAELLRADLTADGATVVMTRDSNTGVGPCVDERAKILNAANPAVSIDIHADGGPASGRGFTVLEPVDDGVNSAVITSSEQFGADLITAFQQTGMPISTYDGTNGVSYRTDLAGLNLTTEPKVLIECGNMRNATDAAMLVSPSFQQAAARSMTSAIVSFVHSEQS